MNSYRKFSRPHLPEMLGQNRCPSRKSYFFFALLLAFVLVFFFAVFLAIATSLC